MKNKFEVSTIFPSFYNMISIQFGVEIKRLRFDNVKDYFNQSLTTFFQQKGIIHESSCPYTSPPPPPKKKQNGVTERKNGHLLAVIRALLFHHNVPKYYWGEAALIATFLINRLPSKILNFYSPIQLLTRFFPDLHILSGWKPKIFGCVAFVHIHGPHRSKLDPQALKCIFVAYSSTQKGYRCYHSPTK